jgi:chemotaxis protein MotB
LSGQTRHRRRAGLDIWPGFVDALATLVMVIVFVLMIFTVFQFHLKDLITGRDLALERMSQRIGALADQLAVERRSASELREQLGLLNADMAASVNIRDRLQSELAAAMNRISGLDAELGAARSRAEALALQLTARDGEAKSLADRLAAAQDDLALSRREIATLLQRLASAETQQRDADRRAAASDATSLSLGRQLSDAEAKLAQTEARLATAEAAATELARRLAAMEARAVAGETDAVDLVRRLSAADAALRDAEARASAGNARATELAQRLAATEARVAATEARVAAGETGAADLARRLAAADAALRDAEARAVLQAAAAAELARKLQAAESALKVGQGKVALTEREAADLLRRLAAAENRTRDADARLADTMRSVSADREKIEVQLRELDALRDNIRTLTLLRDQLERDLSARTAALEGAQASLAGERKLSADAQFRVDRLTRELEGLRQQLGRLETALDASEAKSRAQDVQIVDLGRRLNLALASKIEELARYRSEFFGRLREVLGERGDVRVVGDRFIFETEILFRSASAELEPEGRRQIERVASELVRLSETIPSDINWILQVDGHTDKRPIARSFPSNWELSHARAMSVVRAMIAGGVPAERLVAAGYAEFQPVDPRDEDAAYRRNRRIELKLTAR